MVIWPNEESFANSDPWLVAHHDRIECMEPRVLAVNFVHGFGEAEARRLLDALIAALRESSRWQGWGDPDAPAFLEYRVAEYVDLTEPAGRYDRNSARFPRDGAALDYGALYELLGLAERTDVNEVWLLADHTDHTAPWETVEVKCAYDEAFRPVGHVYDAGNSGPHTAPWIGRSLRTLFVNFARGVGCAIPYYERYFREYAMLDLDRRYGLPFESLYLKGPHPVSYPAPTVLQYRAGWRHRHVEDYVPAGGNVHFMPNGRFDYDLDSEQVVLSTIETWRQADQRAAPWRPTVLDRYRELAPDCMGRWVVYWRQNMPGFANLAYDDTGAAMKNWWPFLFY